MQKIPTQPYMHKNAGFTLVEMLVSLAIFTIVMTMSVGTLLVLIDANGRAQSMQLVMTNLSFALDSMTREIRTATNWYCGVYNGNGTPNIPNPDESAANATRDCNGPSGATYISISESGSSLTGAYGTDRVTYWFDDVYYLQHDEDGSDHGALLRKLGGYSGAEGAWVPLTGPDMDIDEFHMVVDGTTRYVQNGSMVQPNLTIFIKGKAGFETGLSGVSVREFSLQTSITQRLLDI